MARQRQPDPRGNAATQAFADLARAWGESLLCDITNFRPMTSVESAEHLLPRLNQPHGVVINQLARTVRMIVLDLPRVQNAIKRRSLGGTLMAIADTLEALQLPETSPFWLRD